MKTIRLIACAAAAGAWFSAAQAQSITPVWEYLINNLPSPLPILTNATPYTTDDENGDGMSLMDCIGPLRRYDANRLLLGIRENGINETVAHNTNLATAYPDRSLIWINPTNGAPIGIALNMGLFPVPLDTNIVAAGGVPGSYYWSFDVSDDGYVYSGYKNQIIRYAPNGSGGISSTPAVMFTLDQTTATANGVMAAQWSSFRWAHIRVRGSGTNTKVLAGGIGARGVWLLTTANGSTFTAGAHMNGGFGNAAGNISNLIPSQDPATPDDVWFYGGSYPGNSSGIDTTFNRAKASAPFTDPAKVFANDGTFSGQADPNTNAFTRYTGNFSGSADAHPDFDFVVHYSAPSWNSTGIGSPKRPGWLAIHDLTNGTFIAARQLCVTEADELLTADNTALFLATVGSVSLYPLADGSAEILWTSEIYGYGRYIVGSPRYADAYSLTKNIQPLWEQLQGQPNLKLPIIDTDVSSNPVPSDGKSVMHVFTSLKKYDSKRLLLGIRDNGINESVAHNTNLANQFPDRSLQWIDVDTGAPLGTALVIGYPAGTVGDDNHLNMAFGVDAAGVLYVGVDSTIRRYAPSGSGFASPTVAFTAPGGTPQPTKIQFSEFRIKGSGSSTVIVAGNRDWYADMDRILTTTDGLTFTEQTAIPTGFGTGGGGVSSIVPDVDNPSDNLIYRTSYPSTSNGADTTFHRRRQVGGTGDYTVDTFSPEQVAGSSISNSVDVLYRTLFETDVQALPGLDYVVTYSTPSFRTFDNTAVQTVLRGGSTNPMPYQPGWIAVHDQRTGQVRGLHKLNVTEALNVIPTTQAPPIDFYTGWFVYAIPQGGVELYPVLNSAAETVGAEIIWWSATYGYGRYYIDNAPGANKLRHSLVGGKLRLDWTGAGRLQGADVVTGPYSDIPEACPGYLYSGPATKFFRLLVHQ